MKVFVVHYKKLVDRKINIIEQFKKNNITDYEFIEIDRDNLDDVDKSIFSVDYPTREIAITSSHIECYKKIADKYDKALILEDDIIMHENFSKLFIKYLNELPLSFDQLYIGDGCGLHIQPKYLKKNTHIYKKELYPTNWGGQGSSRCTDSYVVNKKCAIKICEYINNKKIKINTPIDFWINDVNMDNNFEVYWAEPTIITQGSQNGTYESV
jgi:glycosyl transferase family 25